MKRLLPRRTEAESDEINISPLIDMTFLLLIFFMVSTTFVRDLELEIQRPGAEEVSVADPRALRVTIDRGGGITVSGRAVEPWMIETVVREEIALTGMQDVLVVSDARSRSGRLVEVVDQCRVAGAREVAVAVEETR